MPISNQALLKEAMAIREELISLRRHLHRHPELSKGEINTAAFVEKYLKDLGLQVRRVANTGVVGLLAGSRPGKTVGLRADMDALPIQELNQTDYCSLNPGVMHACGHDVHTAALLGCARLLSTRREELAGSVKFFFQPNEEVDGGAADMVAEGVMENPGVDAVFGAHVNPSIPAGMIGITYGQSYAAADTFDVVVKGLGSHGAEPHKGVDAIVVAAQIVNALQTIVSRQIDPLDSAVITVGVFRGGTQRNIVANEAFFSGIIRTLNPDTRKKAKDRLAALIQGMAKLYGAEAQVDLRTGYPGVFNDAEMTDLVKNSAAELLGPSRLLELKKPTLGTEDFGIFLQQVPGCFYQIGVQNLEQRPEHPLHSGYFDVDEDCLPTAAAMHAKVALDYLNLNR